MWNDNLEDASELQMLNALLNQTSKFEFMVRKSEPSDVPQIVKLINDETRLIFPTCDAGKILEKSVFSLVLTNASKLNSLMAHASFSDIPLDQNVNIDGKLWKTHDDLKYINSMNGLFLVFFVWSPEIVPEVALQEVIGNVFLACSLVDYIVFETPDVNYTGPFMFPSLSRDTILTTKNKQDKKLLIFNKNTLYPQVKIREGREHDLDDLSPLMRISTTEMEDNFSKSYLNDLIAMSDRNNQSVVAEHKSIAVGMLTVTTDINYNMLNTFFQLEPFHGLYKPHISDELNLAYRHAENGYKVCKEDDKKFVKDEYEESADESDRGSLTTYASSSSFDSEVSTVRGTPVMATDQSQNPTKQISEVFPNASQNNTIIPMVESKDEMPLRGEEIDPIKPSKLTPSEELNKFPPEVIALHEQLRLGKLELADIQQLDEDMKNMLSKLEELTAKRDMVLRVHSSNFHSTNRDEVCYPMTIYTEHRPIYHGIPNALAIQLCVIDKKYNIRILDLIQGAFLCFPNREYCIITTPSGAPVPFWLEYFVRVIPRKLSLYDRELYVLHRNVFNCRLRVRPGNEQDEQKVRKLIETLHTKDKILNDFLRANMAYTCGSQSGLYSFVALAGPAQQSHIIGLIILSDNERTDHYQINYNTDNFIYADLHEPGECAYVHHFVLNPVFRRFAKKIFKEVMRYLKKDVLYHRVYSPYKETVKTNHQTLLNNLDDWYVVPPRPQINYIKLGLTGVYDQDRIPPPEALDNSESFSLLLHSRKFTFDVKAEITARIVFVGASETALACLEKLISTPKMCFLHLTVISPHGLPGSLKQDEIRSFMFPRRGGPSLSVDSEGDWLDRTGIQVKVNVIFGKVTSFLREQKVVVLNRKDVIPYDYLVFTVGQQFVRPDCGEVEVVDYHLNEFIEHSIQQDEKKREKIKKPLRRQTKKPKNVFVINSEMEAAIALNYIRTQLPSFKRQRLLIHGACLESYCCLNAMLKMGVSPERIVFIIRPEFHVDWEERRSYKDTTKLREIMMEALKTFNIKVLPNHDFLDWFLDLRTNTVTRVNFATPNESEIVSHSCFAYFGYSQHRISDEFLSALLDAYITFDKGISVSIDLKTNDNKIWAAGTCAAYDNKLVAEKYDHPFYNSYEVGQLLADKIIQELDPTKRSYSVTKIGPLKPNIPQSLTQPLVHYAELPGGWFYMHCRRPGPIKKCCPQECDCDSCYGGNGTEIITGSTERKNDLTQRYFRLCLDANYRVESMECISKKRFSPWNLSRVYGAHESLLHNLVERFERGEVRCLYNFFQQPWMSAICHDRWFDFRQELAQLYAAFCIDEDLKIKDFIKAYMDNLENMEALQVDANIIRRVVETTGLKRRIEMKFLDFLRFNRNVLPMYARPDFVEKLIEERRLSPLVAPYVTSLYQ